MKGSSGKGLGGKGLSGKGLSGKVLSGKARGGVTRASGEAERKEDERDERDEGRVRKVGREAASKLLMATEGSEEGEDGDANRCVISHGGTGGTTSTVKSTVKRTKRGRGRGRGRDAKGVLGGKEEEEEEEEEEGTIDTVDTGAEDTGGVLTWRERISSLDAAYGDTSHEGHGGDSGGVFLTGLGAMGAMGAMGEGLEHSVISDTLESMGSSNSAHSNSVRSSSVVSDRTGYTGHSLNRSSIVMGDNDHSHHSHPHRHPHPHQSFSVNTSILSSAMTIDVNPATATHGDPANNLVNSSVLSATSAASNTSHAFHAMAGFAEMLERRNHSLLMMRCMNVWHRWTRIHAVMKARLRSRQVRERDGEREGEGKRRVLVERIRRGTRNQY